MQSLVENEKKIAFLVVSCDNYSDLWLPFFTLLDKYWKDRNAKVYLLSNHKDFSWPGVNTIKVGDDVSYSDNLSKAMEEIDEEWILLWLEDLFFAEDVNQSLLDKIISEFQSFDCGYLKIAPDMPLSYESINNSAIGNLPKGIKYRSAIGATLYHKSTLKKLLIPGASAWELDKSNLSDTIDDPFYALTSKSYNFLPIKYVNTLIKGKWSIPSIKFLKKEGFGEILHKRGVESFFSWLYAILFNLRLSILRMLKIHWK